MNSMPAVGVHPSQKWLAMQSLDNQILIYSSPDLKQNRKKRFAGHSVAGYACEIGFSPDGKFISSGDGQGDLVFWSWQNCRLLKRLKTHSKAVITHAWLPHETVRAAFRVCRMRAGFADIEYIVQGCHRLLGRSDKALGTVHVSRRNGLLIINYPSSFAFARIDGCKSMS